MLSVTSPEPVYPRVCGGTARPVAIVAVALRSIPACAGEPRVTFAPYHEEEVYPRVCGGTAWRVRTMNNRQGLSPRVRGNHGVRREPNGASGSIPACAGEPASA